MSACRTLTQQLIRRAVSSVPTDPVLSAFARLLDLGRYADSGKFVPKQVILASDEALDPASPLGRILIQRYWEYQVLPRGRKLSDKQAAWADENLSEAWKQGIAHPV